MNYLAHAYFSFNHQQILVGNMISDFVKGKSQYSYPTLIQAGIQLHRAIDNFTDNHWAVKDAKEIFKPQIGLYSGAFTDIVFDYFLANDKNIFADENELYEFAQTVYKTLNNHQHYLPEKFANVLPYMQQHNWLYYYKDKAGIEKSFMGTTKRAKYINANHQAFDVFINNMAPLQMHYNNFISDLKLHSEQHFSKLLNAEF